LVPDIDTLLEFPDLENWSFPQFSAFHLVLPPTLIRELEELQNLAADQQTWTKCAAAIHQLDDYRRRGCWNERAVLERGRITLSVRPLTPAFDAAVSWLDPASPPDCLVARAVALIREHPRCVVALVTHDANLQKRADESRVDTIMSPAAPVQRAFD
jgi:predicted ribonuclease YlaK